MDYYRELLNMGCNYHADAVMIATVRGWNGQEHIDALLDMDEDRIGMTHPINWLTEDESEEYFV